MINIARSVILALIGLAPFATISIFFIITLIASPNADSGLSLYIGDNLVNSEDLADAGDDVQDVIFDIFRFLRELNIALLSLTLIISLGWSVGSHYLNVDAPGKAKIYSIHWLIFTGIYVAISQFKIPFISFSKLCSSKRFLSLYLFFGIGSCQIKFSFGTSEPR